MAATGGASHDLRGDDFQDLMKTGRALHHGDVVAALGVAGWGFISGCTGAEREQTHAASSELVERVRKVKVCVATCSWSQPDIFFFFSTAC